MIRFIMGREAPMHVCVLYDDEPYGFTPAEFLKKFDWEMVLLHRPVMERLRALALESRFDVYFNLCDGASDEDYPGLDVVEALEELNLPYTGADSKFYDPTREEMQAAADAHGVGFAKGYHVTENDDLKSLVKDLRFPLMVKHPKSYSSIGMTRDSRVENLEQLRTQFERISSEFGSARVEEFIVGREFNVLIVDNPDNIDTPFVYPPTELIFPPGDEFWHTDIKWDYSVPFEFRQVKDPDLVARLQDAGRRMYLAIGGNGYGRCDIRMNASGEIYILEINPNGGILYTPEEYGPADYMILYDKDGYDGFFDRIFRSAMVRQKMRETKRIK
jgi:D-alanine-D-alanine ligase-like ATP-grasp enzyme